MKLILLSFLFTLTFADFFINNPRGSNGRLNEANTNRNNGNRLFDAQNNAKGGYCVGPPMNFYEGSLLNIEFSPSHACGSPNVQCNIVFQYMCGSESDDPLSRIRDGTTTDTIPDNEAGASTTDVNGELKYGMHESYQSFQNCKTRNRNMGLFIADRATQGGLTATRASSIYTRQNNNGNRNGFECPEERDYYPYWHGSQWRDIAVLTDNIQYCDFYKNNSQNVLPKNYCRDPVSLVPTSQNNQADCTAEGNVWTQDPAFGIPPPECLSNSFARDNVQEVSNVYAGLSTYQWRIPTVVGTNSICVLRARYNISSAELGTNSPVSGFLDYNSNGNTVLKQDPVVPFLDGELALAMDTTQFGRVFEDRTHTFNIMKRPTPVSAAATIHNLNVKGKRGNNVQTYPSVQYDFAPDLLDVINGDYIHFQWTGCDTNPAGNAGEGTDQTDRSNIVQMESLTDNIPASETWLIVNPKIFVDPAIRKRMAHLDQVDCLSLAEILAQNGNNQGNAEQDVRNCGKLNAASPYFDGGLIQMNTIGNYHYLSTRNNNFSNRGQKGSIRVHETGWVKPLVPCSDGGPSSSGSILNGFLPSIIKFVIHLF